MKKIFVIFVAITLTGCITPKVAKERYGCKDLQVIEKTDTIEVVREIEKEIPGDSVTVFIPCNEPKDTTVKGKGNSSAKAVYDKKKNGYTVTANCDSLKLKIEARDKIISLYRERIVKDAAEKKGWFKQKSEDAFNLIKNILALIGVFYVAKLSFHLLRKTTLVGRLLG